MAELLKSSPSMAGIYRRVLLERKKGGDAATQLPQLQYVLQGLKIDRKSLKRYCQVCGFDQSEALPATYLQVLAFPLQLAMLTDSRFPLPMLGVVHISNSIDVLRPLLVDDLLDIEVAIAGQREVAKGLEFDIATLVKRDNEIVWRGSATMLYRCKSSISERVNKENTDKKASQPLASNVSEWRLPANLGRCYGRVSADLNPIHLFTLTARLFGFSRAIAHGMWSKAHVLASLDGLLPAAPYQVSVRFKTPILLPNRVRFSYQHVEGGLAFELWNKDASKPHMSGQISSLSE